MTVRILMVDDDASIVGITKLFLTKRGFQVETAFDGQAALEMLLRHSYHLVLLDIMLPVVDGWSVCKQLRERQDYTPVIMLTARGQVHERIEGLRMGADDYVVKPFDIDELIARIETVLRRSSETGKPGGGAGTGMNGSAIAPEQLSLGNLILYPSQYELMVNNEAVALPRREFELLTYLLRNPGRVFTREDLISGVWGWDFDGEDRVVDLYIQRLRSKLDQFAGGRIATIWGVGYKLEVQEPC